MLEQTVEDEGMFLDLVDFKWLMAGFGWRIDLSRLQQDLAYTEECARRGLATNSGPLRQRSLELLSLVARFGA